MTPGRWIAVIIVVAITLTWFNIAYYKHRLAVLTAPLSTKVITDVPAGEPHLSEADMERLKQNLGLPTRRDKIPWEYDWMVGREIVLTVVAIGGVCVLHSLGRGVPSKAH
jgi:hypothetical protein